MSTHALLGALCLGLMSQAALAGAADKLDQALAEPARPAADLIRDETSRPAQVLRFFGVGGDTVVLDLFGGGGYYSELLNYVVDDDGHIYLHNNAAYLGFTGDALTERLANNRLTRVQRYDREADAIDLPDDSVDLVLMVLTYHDLYYKTDGWDLDPDAFFAMVHRILKPGGVLGVVDHHAADTASNDDAQELHRIGAQFARDDISSRGFTFDGELQVLRNADDPLDVSVFDPSVRRKTSRFVYKFVEPRP